LVYQPDCELTRPRVKFVSKLITMTTCHSMTAMGKDWHKG